MNIPLSLPQYFSIGFALIIIGRIIHYLKVRRYLRERGVEVEHAGALIPDWNEWAVYRRTRLSNNQPLTWWYVLSAIQLILFFWLAGWIGCGVGAVKIDAPSHLTQGISDAGDYTTAFDVTQSGYREWWFPTFGLIFVAAGLALPYLIRIGIFRKPPSWTQPWFPVVLVGFAILWTVGSFALTAADYLGLASDLRHGQCEVIEGIVEQFDPMPYEGHKDESFVVAGHRFHYSDYDVSAGFNHSRSHGGPIRDGLKIRIHFKGNEIAKLEIAKRQ